MTFLYPSLLWGLLGLVIPILIHFFNFRRFKVVEFPTVQFIQELKQEVKKKKRLKHLLILLSRLLFFFFLICAFAQPYIQDSRLAGNMIVYVDNSYSMTDEVTSGRSGLIESIEYTQAMLDQVPLEEQVLMLTNDFERSTDNWQYKSAIEEQLTEVSLSPVARSFSQIVGRLPQINEEATLFYISDFQKSTFGALGEIIPPEGRVQLVPILGMKGTNVFVDTVFLEGPIVPDQSNKLFVRLARSGPETSADYQVKLLNGNQLVSTTSFSFDGGTSNVLEFSINPKELSSSQFKIEITDYPVTFDNSYFVVIENVRRPVITYLYQGSYQSYISNVFANQEFFDFVESSSADIDYTRLALSDMVILDGFERFPQGLNFDPSTQLFVIPAREIDQASYEQLLGSSIRPTSDSTFRNLQISDARHPFFQGLFESATQNIDMPRAQLAHQIPYSRSTLLETVFGEPFLVQLGSNNQIYFMVSPLDLSYTNLPLHALFLPMLYRMAYASNQSTEILSYSFRDPVLSFRMQTLDPNAALRVVASTGIEFIPEVLFRDGQLSLTLPPIQLDPGFYHLVSDDDTVKSFALNFGRLESDLEGFSYEELAEWSTFHAGIDVLNIGNAQDLRFEISAQYAGIRLWKYALILAMFFLLCESILVRYYK